MDGQRAMGLKTSITILVFAGLAYIGHEEHLQQIQHQQQVTTPAPVQESKPVPVPVPTPVTKPVPVVKPVKKATTKTTKKAVQAPKPIKGIDETFNAK